MGKIILNCCDITIKILHIVILFYSQGRLKLLVTRTVAWGAMSCVWDFQTKRGVGKNVKIINKMRNIFPVILLVKINNIVIAPKFSPLGAGGGQRRCL